MESADSPWAQLAAQMRDARRTRFMTQKELARRVGRPQPRISELEQGQGDPRISTVLAVATALNLEVLLVPRREAARFRGRPSTASRDPGTVFDELYVEDPDTSDED